jgi:hypothetical protein
MNLSLNEIETMSLRAMRGAGASWGMAEEAGKSARWLAARGLPWLPALLEVIEKSDTLAAPGWPNDRNLAAESRDAALSPLQVGALLCDLGGDFLAAGDLHSAPVMQPLVLLGQIASLTRGLRSPVRVAWADVAFVLAAGNAHQTVGTLADTALPGSHPVTIACMNEASHSGIAYFPQSAGAEADAELWQRLSHYAARTYVPENAQSRERGAGAGAIDND